MKDAESKQVNGSRFISVMADSGTDTCNKDLELVYIRFLGRNTNRKEKTM